MQNVYSTAKICDFKNPKKCDLNLEPGKHSAPLPLSLCECLRLLSEGEVGSGGAGWAGVSFPIKCLRLRAGECVFILPSPPDTAGGWLPSAHKAIFKNKLLS